MHDTLVIIATYNERENLPHLIDAIFEHAPEVDVLVVDDNSPDGTGQWCDQRAEQDARVRCLHRSGKLGLGSAVTEGMQYAIDRGYTCTVNLDGDMSHHPRYLPDLLAAMEPEEGRPVDVMIGSRYVPGGGIQGWPWRRHLMSRCINWFARWMLGLPVRDLSGAYRCYRTAKLAEIDFSQIRSKGYGFLEEILFLLKQQNARFGEIPIVFEDRTHGDSKITWGEAVAAIWLLCRLGCRRVFG